MILVPEKKIIGGQSCHNGGQHKSKSVPRRSLHLLLTVHLDLGELSWWLGERSICLVTIKAEKQHTFSLELFAPRSPPLFLAQLFLFLLLGETLSWIAETMLRSRKSRVMVMLVTAALLLTDMAGVSYGRRLIPDLDAMAVVGGSPPAKGGYMSRLQVPPSDSGHHVGDEYRSMHAVSKRLVPQGPNPLHNWSAASAEPASSLLPFQGDMLQFNCSQLATLSEFSLHWVV